MALGSTLESFLEALDRQVAALVCQDWDGILGLSAAWHYPEWFARMVPANTGLPDGTQTIADSWREVRELVETIEFVHCT